MNQHTGLGLCACMLKLRPSRPGTQYNARLLSSYFSLDLDCENCSYLATSWHLAKTEIIKSETVG